MEALLPDHGRSVARRGEERGHWVGEKSRRDGSEGDLRMIEGTGEVGWGGEMGGRGVDCVLEKVFNPARNWMRGRGTPNTRRIPYREF